MSKRLFDIICSFIILLSVSPILVLAILAVWLQDLHSPFYIAPRVGENMKIFHMIKLRSMVLGADRTGVDSTAGDDRRVTSIGKIIRKFKMDELTQLWNVLMGNMSLVGPRPNVEREVRLYTEEEKHLLDVRPGITDLASIVFSDEGDILEGSDDPDLKYNQVIRPWKSRLGLLYVKKRTFLLDLKIIALTALAILSRPLALRGVKRILRKLSTDAQLLSMAGRQEPLQPYPPPGSDKIVESRKASMRI